jgi:peptidoglycan/LPS O-acetylase OafA/YrhL
MRTVNGFFAAMLAVFALLQYNDPQPVLWFLIYAVPALLCGLAAWRPTVVAGSLPLQAALALCLVAAAIGAVVMWPYEWREWWEREDIRDGMGLIIVTLALAFAALTVWRARRSHAAAGQSGRHRQSGEAAR